MGNLRKRDFCQEPSGRVTMPLVDLSFLQNSLCCEVSRNPTAAHKLVVPKCQLAMQHGLSSVREYSWNYWTYQTLHKLRISLSLNKKSMRERRRIFHEQANHFKTNLPKVYANCSPNSEKAFGNKASFLLHRKLYSGCLSLLPKHSHLSFFISKYLL